MKEVFFTILNVAAIMSEEYTVEIFDAMACRKMKWRDVGLSGLDIGFVRYFFAFQVTFPVVGLSHTLYPEAEKSCLDSHDTLNLLRLKHVTQIH